MNQKLKLMFKFLSNEKLYKFIKISSDFFFFSGCDMYKLLIFFLTNLIYID